MPEKAAVHVPASRPRLGDNEPLIHATFVSSAGETPARTYQAVKLVKPRIRPRANFAGDR
jgi:hypothetical protein